MGDLTGAIHYARSARSAWRNAGLADRGEEFVVNVEQAARQSKSSARAKDAKGYDHPMYWSAFTLVGRVTKLDE
jgi:CHAT domain-containing protein